MGWHCPWPHCEESSKGTENSLVWALCFLLGHIPRDILGQGEALKRGQKLANAFAGFLGLPKMLGKHSRILETPMWQLPSGLVGFVAFV